MGGKLWDDGGVDKPRISPAAARVLLSDEFQDRLAEAIREIDHIRIKFPRSRVDYRRLPGDMVEITERWP